MPSVTRKPTRTRQARRKAVVADMLAAVEALLEEGETFTSLSVERLITQAGMARSTFYVYFEDKGSLLLALAEDVVAQLVEAAGAWWSLPSDLEEPDVEKALRGIIDVYQRHSTVWSSLVDAATYDPKVRDAFDAVVGNAAAGLTKHIRAGQKAGYIRAEVDPKRTALWLTWMTERGLYQLTPKASPSEIDKLCAAQTEIVWRTLYADAPSRR
ncbi:MAG TPA: TetR/AcrR family transcriptional regulator [Baekduia sp.]|nr:TetR/AcrR family transcriptional regulator [Baekduia sp.]